MKKVTRKAYAKINLGLDVLRRRADGYHEVKMIMQTIDLYDTLVFTINEDEVVTLVINGSSLSAGEDNLICKAARLLLTDAGIAKGVNITLEKRIPIAAGMAGGSSDAAATLWGLNELFDLGYGEKELQDLGVKLGADIPYCLSGGTALSEGIGEILTPLSPPPACHLAVAKPDIDVSTKYVYEHLQADRLTYHPDIDGMVDAIKNGDLTGITKRMGNVLETVTIPAYPIIDSIKECMKKAGADNALMSGSGPTVFGIFGKKEDAEEAADRIKREHLADQVFVTGWYPKEETV